MCFLVSWHGHVNRQQQLEILCHVQKRQCNNDPLTGELVLGQEEQQHSQLRTKSPFQSLKAFLLQIHFGTFPKHS
jgi:hypothetical protein